MDQLFSRIPFLETLLWILAVIAAFVAFLVIVPGFFNNPVADATPVGQFTITPRATLTPLQRATSIALAPPPKPQPTNPIPTPPSNARAFTFVADPRRSGWLASGDKDIHWGDRNFHAGAYQGQVYRSVIYFDMSEFAPGTRFLFAEVELTGLNRSNLGATGTWTLELLPSKLLANWTDNSNTDLADTVADSQIGAKLLPSDLAEGQLNQFVFAPDQLSRLATAIDQTGRAAFRIVGPSGPEDSLFTWDGGDPDPAVGAHPIMRVVAVPGQFAPITNTPTPQNVLTAAAVYVQGTESAKLYGTPTPLPRKYATFVPLQAVTSQPTPANSATAQAQAAYATAVALTTGTFTPTPPYWVTTTPTPFLLALDQFTPIPSPTPTYETSRLEQLRTPIPTESGLYGKIAFLTDREGAGTQQVWVMNSDGTVVGKLNGDEFYQISQTHTLFSPDKLFQVDVAKNDNGLWEIVILDVAKGVLSRLITEAPTRHVGVGSYHPAWSPLGDQIVYVSDRAGTDEIFVYDVKTKISKRLTFTDPNRKTNEWAQNKHPSWSPDGKQIVFSSNREPYPLWQLWIMNADGGGLRRLSPSPYNDTDPVWIR